MENLGSLSIRKFISRRGSDSPVHRREKTPRFQIPLDKWPVSPGTPREASGVPCLEWKERNTDSKPKLEKRMDYKGAMYTTDPKGIHAEPINYANALKDELPFIKDYSWSFHKSGETRIEVGVNVEKLLQGQLEMAWYVATPVIKSTTTNAKPAMTAEDIKKALATMPDELRKAILASME